MSARPSFNTVGDLIKAMGEWSRSILLNRLEDAFSDREISAAFDFRGAGVESLSMSDLMNLWREYIGPKYYYDSILSVQRQVEILAVLGRPLNVYRERKARMLHERRERWRSLSETERRKLLSEVAWSSVNTTDSTSGFRLQLGLRNAGCRYWQEQDGNIGCYNCGYFAGCVPHDVAHEELSTLLVEQFRKTVGVHSSTRSPAFDTIDIVGDGSFLNPREVPVSAQDDIFKIIASTETVSRVLVESRPEYVSQARIDTILGLLRDDQILEIAIGVETADAFVASFCINKGFAAKAEHSESPSRYNFEGLVAELAQFKERCRTQAYVLLKPALLNESEAIADTVNTVRWLGELARRMDVSIRAKIEPTVVCYGSLLEVLNDTWISSRGHVLVCPEEGDCPGKTGDQDWRLAHTAPSYWSVVETLAEVVLEGNHHMCRVGAREDMDVFKSIPAVYSGESLSAIDPILYNAVQQFNSHPNDSIDRLVRFLSWIKPALKDPSFDKWRATAERHQPAIATLCGQFDYEIGRFTIKNKCADGKRDPNVIRRIAQSFQEDAELHMLAVSISERWRDDDHILRDRFAQQLLPMVTRIVETSLTTLPPGAIHVDQVQFVHNPPASLRFEVNLNGGRARGVDIWVILPIAPQKEEVEPNPEEIERKWIVDHIPRALLRSPVPILQAYVSISRDGEVRVRRKASKNEEPETYRYVITVKSSGDRIRLEYESDVDRATFDTLALSAGGRTVEKDRYVIDDPVRTPELVVNGRNVKIELDVYKGHLQGLVIAEVEFQNETEADAFVAPDWFGLEVTFDRRFKNQSLATEGFSGIFIRPNTRYTQSVLILDPAIPPDLQDRIKEFSENLLPASSLLRRDTLPQFVGRIRRETADVLWSCALCVVGDFRGDPNELVLQGLARQTERPLIRISGTDILSKSEDSFLDGLRIGVVKACKGVGASRLTPNRSGDLSKIIMGQRFVDNELLAQIESRADTVHVVTTTLEFDLGDLRETVLNNLRAGKRYRYYVPSSTSERSSFPELQANAPEFAEIFRPYRKDIQFAELPKSFVPFYREIVVYESADRPPFGFSYLEPKEPGRLLELFEVPPDLLPETLQWLGKESRSLEIWGRER